MLLTCQCKLLKFSHAFVINWFPTLLFWGMVFSDHAAWHQFCLLWPIYLYCYLKVTEQHLQFSQQTVERYLHMPRRASLSPPGIFSQKMYGFLLHFTVLSTFYIFYPLYLLSSSWWSIFWLSPPYLTCNLEPVVTHLPCFSPPHHMLPTLTLFSCIHHSEHLQEHWIYLYILQ